uniref:guanylyl cyclase C-like n=1 Tax=Centroberyx gerrardi TaxID=166262 RepID=UPI003AAA61E3
MGPGGRWLCVCALGMLWAVGACRGISDCQKGIMINVILLNDDESPWSLKYVQGEIERAIESDSNINAGLDVKFNLTANFRGFETTLYRRKGCSSSACEGVEMLKNLTNSGELGCALLGPTCTYATFQMVDLERGLKLSTPIMSAGSFGLSCDYTLNLQRVLPPARKISNFFTQFWKTGNAIKPVWSTAFVYKKPINTEECFWYINALDAGSAQFSSQVQRAILRKPEELKAQLKSRNRTSNMFIICGSPEDLVEVKNGTVEANSPEVLFILIDLYNDDYYTNKSSLPSMENVLVLTMPNTRSYTIDNDLGNNNTMNDYMAAYHDSVLLLGKVMREIYQKDPSEIQQMESVNVNYFRNVSFNGIAGNYKLDEHGDRDVNFSIIYTTNNKYELLFTFNTEDNYTSVVASNPSFIWGKSLPDDKPQQGLREHDIIVIVLAVTVVVVATIAFIFYRQNRRHRQIRKRWSHIPFDLITLLEHNERNVISLKIDDERKDKNYKIRRGRYDKKIVILKELKYSDGNFNESQRIELNSLRHIDYYNLTKFYGTVKFEQGVFGVFEYGERGSLRYVLNDKVSYPEETFMDWEFKISVMYDIAKGMSYLHASDIQVHGRLKSTNCVVDNRMVVKITDFGCNTILNPGRDLWTAPEHLRKQGISQKGDVYSFAIIAQEIVLRKSTFYTECCSDRA